MRGGDQRFSGARASGGASASSSSTHVSFEPPPWEELTIIEPSRSATRVSPPGTMWMSSPKTANGRRSTWRGASLPSGPAVGTVESCTRSCAIQRSGRRLISSAWRSDLLLGRGRADEDALAAGLARRLDHDLIEALEHPLALLAVGHQVRRHVLDQRLLAEVVADHLRDVVVDRLVVGDAGADRVDDRDAARAVGAHQARDAEHAVGPELERVHEVVVDPAVDRVDALQAAGGADVADGVADHEVAGLDELDAHLAREEGVLEVGAVVRAGRPDDDGRLLLPAGRRDLLQRGPEQRRVVVDGPHAVVLEQRRAAGASSRAGSRARRRCPTACGRCPRAPSRRRRSRARDRSRRRGSRRRRAGGCRARRGRRRAATRPAPTAPCRRG